MATAIVEMPDSSTPKSSSSNPDYVVSEEDVSSQVADEDFIPPEITSPKISQEKLGVHILEKPRQNRKRIFSSYISKADDRDVPKLSKTEVCNVSDQVRSVPSESSVENKHHLTDKSATMGQIELDNSSFTDACSEFWTNKESHSGNQVIQEPDLENKEKLTIAKKASLNMSSFQKQSAPDNVSVTKRSKGLTSFLIKDILDLAGSSRIDENIPSSDFRKDKDTKETSLCMTSENKTTKHIKENEDKVTYHYCQCKYINNEMEQLMNFCEAHFSDPYFCNKCKNLA